VRVEQRNKVYSIGSNHNISARPWKEQRCASSSGADRPSTELAQGHHAQEGGSMRFVEWG
jgi:hypothetical protein